MLEYSKERLHWQIVVNFSQFQPLVLQQLPIYHAVVPWWAGILTLLDQLLGARVGNKEPIF